MLRERLSGFAVDITTRRLLGLVPQPLLADGSCLVFKGAYTSRALYTDSSQRPYCDIDVLTTPRDGERFVNAALAAGWRIHPETPAWRHHSAPWSVLDPASQGISLFHPSCKPTTIDLQWRIGPGGIAKGGIPALLRDARPFEIDGVKVTVPSELDTVLLAALYTVREFPVGGAETLARDLDLAVAKWFRTRFDVVIDHARRRGLLRVLHAATAFGTVTLEKPEVLPDLLAALPPDDAAARWHQWFAHWPAEGPGSSRLLEHSLAAVSKNGARLGSLLLYSAFADSWPRRALIGAHIAQHVIASRVFGRFLRAPIDRVH
jgi:hypothetical protein